MPNKNYLAGTRRERMFVNRLKDEGFSIAFRSAGSHSPIDVVAIKEGVIYLLQCKPASMSLIAKQKIEREYAWLNNQFKVNFKVVTLFDELKEIKK